jgi:hypothetical protein
VGWVLILVGNTFIITGKKRKQTDYSKYKKMLKENKTEKIGEKIGGKKGGNQRLAINSRGKMFRINLEIRRNRMNSRGHILKMMLST